MPATELNHVLQVYMRQGWYPVPWRHHPPEIRELIRAIGFRPQIKCCYANCQRLAIGNQMLRFGLDLQYREGWIIHPIPIQHAWLIYRGQVLDPTLLPQDLPETRYLDSLECSVEEIISSMIKTQSHGPVHSELERAQIGPYWDLMQQHRLSKVG